MDSWIRFVGPTRALEVFGVRLVGLSAENGKKLLLSIPLVFLGLAVSRALRWVAARACVRAKASAWLSFDRACWAGVDQRATSARDREGARTEVY